MLPKSPKQTESARPGDFRKLFQRDGLLRIRFDVFLGPPDLPQRRIQRFPFDQMTVVVPVAAKKQRH